MIYDRFSAEAVLREACLIQRGEMYLGDVTQQVVSVNPLKV